MPFSRDSLLEMYKWDTSNGQVAKHLLIIGFIRHKITEPFIQTHLQAHLR